MSELANLLWETNEASMRATINCYADVFDNNEEFKKLKIFKSGVLVGVCIYKDLDDNTRFICEMAYLGTDKYIVVKFKNFIGFKNKNINKKFILSCQKTNTRLFEFYKRLGFQVFSEDNIKYVLSYGG